MLLVGVGVGVGVGAAVGSGVTISIASETGSSVSGAGEIRPASGAVQAVKIIIKAKRTDHRFIEESIPLFSRFYNKNRAKKPPRTRRLSAC